MELTHTEQQNEKRIKRGKNNYGIVGQYHHVIHIIEVPKEKRERARKIIWGKKKVAENFHNLRKETDIQL